MTGRVTHYATIIGNKTSGPNPTANKPHDKLCIRGAESPARRDACAGQSKFTYDAFGKTVAQRHTTCKWFQFAGSIYALIRSRWTSL